MEGQEKKIEKKQKYYFNVSPTSRVEIEQPRVNRSRRSEVKGDKFDNRRQKESTLRQRRINRWYKRERYIGQSDTYGADFSHFSGGRVIVDLFHSVLADRFDRTYAHPLLVVIVVPFLLTDEQFVAVTREV